jgi:hypothetical protein
MIVDQRGYYDCHGDKRLALLHKGDALSPVRIDGNIIICDAVCRNSGRSCRIEYPIDCDRLNALCEPFGYGCQFNELDDEGGGNDYELWSNEHSPGVTGVYETLDELVADVAMVAGNHHPL